MEKQYNERVHCLYLLLCGRGDRQTGRQTERQRQSGGGLEEEDEPLTEIILQICSYPHTLIIIIMDDTLMLNVESITGVYESKINTDQTPHNRLFNSL